MNFKELPKKIAGFFKEIRLEVKKVNWPSRKETVRDTLIVLGISIIVAVYLGGIDFIFTQILDRFI